MSDPILMEMRADLKKIDRTVTRLEERTMQHEKRMDRDDRRSGAIGAGAGLFGGVLGAFLKSLVHPGGQG